MSWRRSCGKREMNDRSARRNGGREGYEMAEKKRKKGAAPALALWALLARCSIYKVLGVLAVMASAEVMLFYRYIRTEREYYTEYHTLAGAVEGSHVSVVFLAALGLVYFALVWTEGRLDSQSSGTMLRLRLSGGGIFRIKTAYNAACLVLLFAVQIWLCIWMVGIYGKVAEEVYASPQRLFLAFYRIDFLHCLLPMADVGKWVRNILLLLAFGTEAAERAEKTKYVPSVLLYVLTAGWFVSFMGGSVTDWLSIILYVFVLAVNVQHAYKAGKGKVRSYA